MEPMDDAERDRLLEESDQVYHRHVAGLQLQCQKIREELMEANRIALEKYIDENPDEDAEEAYDNFDGLLAHNMEAMRHQTYQCIEQERIRKDQRDVEIVHRFNGHPTVD